MNYSSLYEYLIIAIVLQNATVRRSVSMMQALLENYGTLLSYDGQKLYCFWEPEVIDAVTVQELRALKVGYRAKSIIESRLPLLATRLTSSTCGIVCAVDRTNTPERNTTRVRDPGG